MNERNKEALAELLNRAGTQPPEQVAEWLIERGGVLVPSAMIDQDCADLFFESDQPPAQEIRARLERIARGEEAQPGQPW
jgi:hypothetical protein